MVSLNHSSHENHLGGPLIPNLNDYLKAFSREGICHLYTNLDAKLVT